MHDPRDEQRLPAEETPDSTPGVDGARSFKFKEIVQGSRRSGFSGYRELYYGDTSLLHLLKCELITTLLGPVPGALGLFLRAKTYPLMFRKIGKQVVFGRNVVIRHAHKIAVGDNVVIDDNCVIDAKGETNNGIVMEDNVYIGRNTIVYCKNGDISLEQGANISSNCQIFSSNKLTVGHDTVVGAFSYFLSGGEYDYRDRQRTFAQQSGMLSKGELVIGANCWISARVTVVDAASIGEHCVIGAGAVVTEPIPADSLAVGMPARVVKSI